MPQQPPSAGGKSTAKVLPVSAVTQKAPPPTAPSWGSEENAATERYLSELRNLRIRLQELQYVLERVRKGQSKLEENAEFITATRDKIKDHFDPKTLTNLTPP